MLLRALVVAVLLAGCRGAAPVDAGVDAGQAPAPLVVPSKALPTPAPIAEAPLPTLAQQLYDLDATRLPGPGPSPFTHLGSRPGVAWYAGNTSEKQYVAIVFAVDGGLSVFTVAPPVEEARVLGPDAVLLDDGSEACITAIAPSGYGQRAAIAKGWCGPTRPLVADVDGDGAPEVLAPGPLVVHRKDGGFVAVSGDAACARLARASDPDLRCSPDGGWAGVRR